MFEPFCDSVAKSIPIASSGGEEGAVHVGVEKAMEMWWQM